MYANDYSGGQALLCTAIPKMDDLEPVRLQVVTVDMVGKEVDVRRVFTEFRDRMAAGRTNRLELRGEVKNPCERVRDSQDVNPLRRSVGIAKFFGKVSWHADHLRGAALSIR